ncbi:MAG: 5-formyltetrahydrofolate cyclo-ligase [Coriobacteriaceae bacterium]|nr:5-formyltetrahydrofolate cyclo-ligase [Coriobacteriaceae bacterium]
MAAVKRTKKTADTNDELQPSTQAQELLDKKAELRRDLIERRQEIRPSARSAKSRDICNQLLELLKASGIKGKGGQPATLAVYAALRYEVDLDRFIRGAYAYGYRIVFPCLVPNDASAGTMSMRSVSCNNYLGGNVPFIVDPRKPWGPAVTEEHQTYMSTRAGATRRFIPSRVKGSVPPKDDTRFPVIPPSEIDLVIALAVAFDAQGNRLGYGRGTYDRYLPQLREDCMLLGVAFAEQEVEAVPIDKHDRTIPRFITA